MVSTRYLVVLARYLEVSTLQTLSRLPKKRVGAVDKTALTYLHLVNIFDNWSYIGHEIGKNLIIQNFNYSVFKGIQPHEMKKKIIYSVRSASFGLYN